MQKASSRGFMKRNLNTKPWLLTSPIANHLKLYIIVSLCIFYRKWLLLAGDSVLLSNMKNKKRTPGGFEPPRRIRSLCPQSWWSDWIERLAPYTIRPRARRVTLFTPDTFITNITQTVHEISGRLWLFGGPNYKTCTLGLRPPFARNSFIWVKLLHYYFMFYYSISIITYQVCSAARFISLTEKTDLSAWQTLCLVEM